MSGDGIEIVEVGRLEQIRVLRRVFGTDSTVSTAPLAAMAALISAVRIPAGTRLHEADQPVAHAYLVLEGELASAYNDKITYLFGPTDSLGMLPALARKRSGFAAWATKDTLALRWRVDDMLEVFEDHFELLHSALRGMSEAGIELRKQLPPHAGFSNSLRTSVECGTPDQGLDLVERILCLRHTFGLESSHVDELAELARASVEMRYPADTSLWAAGESSDSILIILRGVMRGSTDEGLEFRLGPGDIAGGLGTLAELPRWYDATVIEPIVALSVSREVMIDLLEDQPELGFDFLRLMAAMVLDLRLRVSALQESRGEHGPHPFSPPGAHAVSINSASPQP